tara:strand:- start:166 stop:327 length:162 start_codon:yes stop_codon:yes gene_type:complete
MGIILVAFYNLFQYKLFVRLALYHQQIGELAKKIRLVWLAFWAVLGFLIFFCD